MMPQYVRLRADPEKIHIGIRYLPIEGEWMVVLTQKKRCVAVISIHSSPEVAMWNVLNSAKRQTFDGIDLDMEWAYLHPQFLSQYRHIMLNQPLPKCP